MSKTPMKRELVIDWDVRLADWRYGLVFYGPDGGFSTVAYGDQPWAVRHAAHYGIELPEIPER